MLTDTPKKKKILNVGEKAVVDGKILHKLINPKITKTQKSTSSDTTASGVGFMYLIPREIWVH